MVMEPSRKPLNVLVRNTGSYVSVVLKNNSEYRGRMVECDGYMNILLEGAKEYRGDELIASYGSLFIRGNNIQYIKLDMMEAT